jgi:hypothetical protein
VGRKRGRPLPSPRRHRPVAPRRYAARAIGLDPA